MSRCGGRWRSFQRWIVASCAVLAAFASASTSLAQHRPKIELDDLRLCGQQDALWLLRNGTGDSLAWVRSPVSPFSTPQPLNRRVELIVAVEDGAIVFCHDYTIFRLSLDGATPPSPVSRLPGPVTPLHADSDGERVFAIVPSSLGERLPRYHPDPAATTQPFRAGSSSLCVVQYDGWEWVALVECPSGPAIDAGTPQLCWTPAGLMFFWQSDRAIHHARFDAETQQWSASGSTAPGAFEAFWVMRVGGVPTLLVRQRANSAAPATVSAFRMLGSGAGSWRPAAWNVDAGEHGPLAKIHSAVGFNQHVALLAEDSAGTPLLAYGRLDDAPVERTRSVAEILYAQDEAERLQRPAQLVTMVLLVLIFTGLFVYRRDAMMRNIPPPPGWTITPAILRLAGWLIDITVFAIAAGWALEVDILEAIRSLGSWGFGTDPKANFPPERQIGWWLLTAGGSTLYSMIMELLTRRSVGKVMTGSRVVSIDGRPASVGAILVRNVFRLVELMPQFWALGFLLLLTRNRQRLGDIFARTVVVRRAGVYTAGSTDGSGPDNSAGAPGA